MRTGLLFRSTDLSRLDAAGLATLETFGLRTVIDLRTRAERQAAPDRPPRGATERACDVLAGAQGAAPAQLQRVLAAPRAAASVLGDGKAEKLFERGYRDIVSLPSALTAYRDFLSALANGEDQPLLFHCTTGKDRTGWAAAVTLTILGVSREDVTREYLLTNDQLLPALQPLIDGFRAAGGDPDLLGPVLGVRASYLEAAFDEVRRRFGSMDGYLTDGLGLDAVTRAHLRANLTDTMAA